MSDTTLRIREMRPGDAETVARLHAESWRSTYRGMLRDEYLDGPIFREHLESWSERLSRPDPGQISLLAEYGAQPVGFVFAIPGHHAKWGTFLDNLHISPSLRGQGTGTCLLRALCDRLMEVNARGGLYLWVFEDNHRTRAYYERLGAIPVERMGMDAPGGGVVSEWLYRWTTLALLRDALE